MTEHPVMFIDDLAVRLRCSVSTIRGLLRTGQSWRLPPESSHIDKRHRWERAVVEQWLTTHDVNAVKLRRIA
jgi:hypothetical protein